MKKFSYLVILLLLSNYSSAQTTPTPEATPPVKIARPFKHNFQVGFTLNQASFSDNWKGGGVNSFAFGGFLNYNVKYKNENLTTTRARHVHAHPWLYLDNRYT